MNRTAANFRTTILLFLFVVAFSCSPREEKVEDLIRIDQLTLAEGERLYEQNCATCHAFDQDGIGPRLGGLTRQVSVDWLRAFIANPTEVIDSGDERGQALFARYRSYMPGFSYLGEEGIDALIAYMHQFEAAAQPTLTRVDSVVNPIPDPIPLSDLVVDLELTALIPYSSEEMPRTRIAKLDYEPSSGDLYISDLRGKMYHLQDGTPEVYLDMEVEMPQFINKPGLATGLGSFAFHPDFAKNGLLYTSHTEKPGSAPTDFGYGDSIKSTLQWVVLEWQTENPQSKPFKGKSRELFRIDMVTGIHGMQELTFNPLAKPGDEDYGLLYIGIGDGGSLGAGYQFISFGPTQAWGSIFRIDPKGTNSRNGNYGIPPSNPFVGDTNKLPEIYTHGFRNPHRLTWTKAGQKLATNIGQGRVESLYMLQPGEDYGWPVREGIWVIDHEVDINQVFELPPNDADWGFTYPVAMYDHDEGNAISGGFEYWGSALPKLNGKYLFGDIVRGRLFYVETDKLAFGKTVPVYEWRVRLNGEIKTLVELSGTNRVDLRLGRDAAGELYIFTKPDGKVYKLVGTN
ncbi:MAG: PQQ-dependent sugar dehydrogenase [Lunatimonas sp.]|uniref:PQQ-dependent sugar dehydrogenase n=1 Tax=Lunatimonas sp. TaxID=2060141 RepID=UPI00263A634C|nr:PQQ-dependent sugar dehydrogenase [Lunatimonas sp.]MCC5937757.1 PQQ-dependent sugar dehydrogenase [Lunatimonas sp.]